MQTTVYTFSILLTFADGRTETVQYDHSLGRYAVLAAKKRSGAKSAKILSRKPSEIFFLHSVD